jgi:Xaa-Pro aminopeptidase
VALVSASPIAEEPAAAEPGARESPAAVEPAAAAPPAVAAEEYAARRARLAEAVGPDSLVLLFSPPPAVRNGDVEWPFRQDDGLLYLTGISQADTTLALLPGESDHREVVFTLDRDPLHEVWTGDLLDRSEVEAVSGVGEVDSSRSVERFVEAALGGGAWGESDLYRYYRPPGLPAITAARRAGRATVWLDLTDRGTRHGPPPPALRLARELVERWPEIEIRDVGPLIDAQREVKSPAELALIERAIAITEEAHRVGMRRAHDAEWEYQAQAAIDWVFRDRGACCWGFPSIVASGRNTTVLHYPDADAPIDRGGLMLFDIGAEVAGYTADVTRTFPADGTFSPEQRAIYEVVLTAWQECLAKVVSGGQFAEVHRAAEQAIARGLAELGLVSEATSEQARMYFVHGVGHPLGLEVHDVFDNVRPLEPGMVWTVEPGVYVRRADVEASGVFAGLSEEAQAEIRAALDRYDGIGVRIEDDLLVTDGAPRVLSDGVPRTVEGIEALLARLAAEPPGLPAAAP